MNSEAKVHFQKLLAGRKRVQQFAELFERLMSTTSDPRGKALLVRMLSEADQMIAGSDKSMDREVLSE